MAERFFQTVRGLQKTLISHLERAIQAAIPAGHPMIQWATAHSAWIYNRFHVHSSLRSDPTKARPCASVRPSLDLTQKPTSTDQHGSVVHG